MTRKLAGKVIARQPAAKNGTRYPFATQTVRALAADVRQAIGVRVIEYFAEDYMVNNRDYVYTAEAV